MTSCATVEVALAPPDMPSVSWVWLARPFDSPNGSFCDLARVMLLGDGVSSLFAGVESLQYSLDYHQRRQTLIISNIAHVDTPGYVSKDLARAPASAEKNAFEVVLRKTSDKHVNHGGKTGQTPAADEKVFDDPSKSANDTNSVSLDREASKAAANQIRYDVLATLVSGDLHGLAAAATDFKTG